LGLCQKKKKSRFIKKEKSRWFVVITFFDAKHLKKVMIAVVAFFAATQKNKIKSNGNKLVVITFFTSIKKKKKIGYNSKLAIVTFFIATTIEEKRK
jgi:hypothetical protein